MVLAEFGTGQMFWSILWFFFFIIWIWLVLVVFGDIFRARDLSGWGKALWTIVIIFLPYFGIFVYFIARGHKMRFYTAGATLLQEAELRPYVDGTVAPALG